MPCNSGDNQTTTKCCGDHHIVQSMLTVWTPHITSWDLVQQAELLPEISHQTSILKASNISNKLVLHKRTYLPRWMAIHLKNGLWTKKDVEKVFCTLIVYFVYIQQATPVNITCILLCVYLNSRFTLEHHQPQSSRWYARFLCAR